MSKGKATSVLRSISKAITMANSKVYYIGVNGYLFFSAAAKLIIPQKVTLSSA